MNLEMIDITDGNLIAAVGYTKVGSTREGAPIGPGLRA